MKWNLVVAGLLVCASAQASTVWDAVSLGGTAQVSWFDNQKFAYDTELGPNAAISLVPHISLVGSSLFGLGQKYNRSQAGVRFTVTDAQDPKFSVGVGV
jgi:uncharacterized membrane protein YedE/YeeE